MQQATGLPGARIALWLLLGINLFNYIDRQVLSAVLPKLALDASIFSPSDPNLKLKLGSLTTAFLVSYMLLSPVFGWLSESRSRWLLIGIGVSVWSLASGGSGLATSFVMLLLTRCCVGVGEAAYGPVAPSMLSDLYPEQVRGKILSWFYLAIPVGSALGFVIGGHIAETAWGWRGAFLVVVIPGLILGALCFFRKDPPRTLEEKSTKHGLPEYRQVFARIWKVPSFRFNTIAMTASTFILGGVATFAPLYFFERESRFEISDATLQTLGELKASDGTPVVSPEVIDKLQPLTRAGTLSSAELKQLLKEHLTADEVEQYNSTIFDKLTAADSIKLGEISTTFGAIVVISGLFATLLGGMLGDKLRNRFPALILVAGFGCLAAFPFFLAMLFVPSPYSWICMFVAVFGLFFNTGPANTILANVVPSSIRASAFAINILIIHTLGDAISPLIIGKIADFTNLHDAFFVTSFFILLAGIIWTLGARHLERDTKNAHLVMSTEAVVIE